MATSIDSTGHYIAFYFLNGILIIEILLTLFGTWSTRKYPCMIKRRVELNFATAIFQYILAQRVLNTGFENWTSLRPTADPMSLLIDIAIISSLIPVNLGCGTFQLLILLNDAYVSQQLLKASGKRPNQQNEKDMFTKFDYLFLSLFGIRRKSFLLGSKKTKYLDFSRSSIIRSLFVLFFVCVVLGISFSLILFHIMNWDAAKVSKNWAIVWIYVTTVSLIYLFTYQYYVWKAKNVNDSYFIWKENFVKDCIYCTFAIPPLAELFIPQLQLIRNIGLNCAISLYIMFLLSIPLPVLFCYYFLFSMERRIKGLSVSLESFGSVFSDKHMWNEFKKLLAKDFCMENAFFVEEYDRILHKEKCNTLAIPSQLSESNLLATSSALTQLSNSTFILTCNNALDIYEVFLKSNCMYELNISFKAKNAVSEIVKKGTLTIDDLQPVYLEVVNSMLSNTFARFIRLQSKNIS